MLLRKIGDGGGGEGERRSWKVMKQVGIREERQENQNLCGRGCGVLGLSAGPVVRDTLACRNRCS